MNLHDALGKIAAQLSLDADALRAYADEDTVGGYHSDASKAKWDMGSIWEVEGQVLYALVRAIKPNTVVNLGVFHGCSCMHILEALKANGEGQLVAVDKAPQWRPPRGYKSITDVVSGDALQYVTDAMPSRRVDLVFEDLDHTPEQVATVWREVMPKLKNDGVIISHDAAHVAVGETVRGGIDATGHPYTVYDISPSDCGLAIGQKLG